MEVQVTKRNRSQQQKHRSSTDNRNDQSKRYTVNTEQGKFPQDVVAWIVSMLFIVVLLGGMFIWGNSEGWNAQSGYYYDDVNNTQQRFLPEPYGCNDTLAPGRDTGYCEMTWYLWKLPPGQVSALTRGVVWLLYSLHQIFVWALIYRAQLIMAFKKQDHAKYDTKLRWFNWSLLIVNAIFHILHLVQTHWTYDATAQDVAVSSSQASVIMMICFILLMEYKDRGFMLMWPNPRSDDKFAKYLRLHPAPIELIRKYHGIAFSWATIYTFWYHPMENTWGHAFGFFHTAIVLLQGSLIYTDMHLNRYWRLLNEVWVLVHGTLVAVQTGDPVKAGGSSDWPRFALGFGFIVAFTQIFSLPLWKRIHHYFRIIPVLSFLVIVLTLCGTIIKGLKPGQTGFGRMYEMFFIPSEEYMMLFVSWLFLYAFIQLEAMWFKNRPRPATGYPSATKQAFSVGSVILVYALLILFSHLTLHLTYHIVLLMIVFVFLFSFSVSITIMISSELMGTFGTGSASLCKANLKNMCNHFFN